MNRTRLLRAGLGIAGIGFGLLSPSAEPSRPTPPPLDLSGFHRSDFEKALTTVGPDKLKPSESEVIRSLPVAGNPARPGLSDEELGAYMQSARRLFEVGDAVPVADVSLDSSLDAGVRQPMLNYISLFTNAVVDVYLLVQKPLSQAKWNYYSIVQDKTVSPNVAHYADVLDERVHFKGAECFACHASGPRIVRPFRPDLLSDARQAGVINGHITNQDYAALHFPADEPRVEYGPALAVRRCAKCHSESGDRGPLYRVHSPSIRALVEHGFMPPKGGLATNELADLMAWLKP